MGRRLGLIWATLAATLLLATDAAFAGRCMDGLFSRRAARRCCVVYCCVPTCCTPLPCVPSPCAAVSGVKTEESAVKGVEETTEPKEEEVKKPSKKELPVPKEIPEEGKVEKPDEAKVEKPDEGMIEKPAEKEKAVETPEKPDMPETPKKPDMPEKAETPEKAEMPEKAETPEKMEPAKEKEKGAEEKDPFSRTDSGRIRLWTDISGQYNCEAKYVSFSDGTVRLHKASGRYVRIAMDNLSLADQEFVRGQLGAVATK